MRVGRRERDRDDLALRHGLLHARRGSEAGGVGAVPSGMVRVIEPGEGGLGVRVPSAPIVRPSETVEVRVPREDGSTDTYTVRRGGVALRDAVEQGDAELGAEIEVT